MKSIHTPLSNPFAAILTLSVLFLTLAVYSKASAADTDVSKEVKEAAAAIADYSVEQKDAAVEKAKEMMDAMDDRIHELEGKMEANWGDMKESTREKYKTSLRTLREKRNDLSQWYGSMKHSSKGAWHEVKTGFAKSYDSLTQSMKDAKKEMTEE